MFNPGVGKGKYKSPQEYEIPYLSQTEQSSFRIITIEGHIFWVHNIKESYNYLERREVIRHFSNHCDSMSHSSPRQDAYSIMLWMLFEDYLNGNADFPRFKQMSREEKMKRTLYVLRHSNGFIKVGIASDIDKRLVDLNKSFGGHFEVLALYPEMSFYEQILIYDLSSYYKPIRQKRDVLSRECFEDCKEVLDVCLNLKNNVNTTSWLKMYRGATVAR